ncbi:MAG: hypothetical protein PHG84_06230 [Endomicrobiaceae bacterium]|nr:hypothetical protein [Endomicrobiaceae bacterium]
MLDERIIKNEYKRTLDSLNGEMPDIIIITVDNIDDIEFCENILTDIKNHPNFSKTMIKYIVKDRSGTGIGFTQAVQYLQDNNLKKQKEDIKAVIIDIENENKDVIANRDLPLQFNGRNITPLELAVLNGIRSCHKFQNSGGIAVIDPNNIYIGNMVPTGDITFISSAVNIKEIQNHQMSLVLKEYPDKLEQIYYGFNPDKISDIVERKGIEYKNYYNFDNQEIKQFEVITGNILIKFDKKDNYLNFFDFMSAIGNYAKQGTNKVNLIQHIFVPFIRANHHSKVQSYFAKTRPKDETSDERNFFLGLAEIFNRPANTNFQLLIDKIKVGVYQQSKSFYSKNFSQITFDKLSAIVKAQQTVLSYNNKSSKTKFFKQLPIKVTGKFKEDTALSRAYMLLSQIQNKQLDSLVDYEQVYETLIEIVRTTTFQRELYTTDNVNTAKLYIYTSDFISNTIVGINKEMESDNSKIDRIYLENLKITFLSLQNYTIEYIRLLDYTSNLSTLGGYVYPKDSWFEKYKLMPFNRFVFGFSRGIKKSKKDIRQQATTVYSLGNFLIESLYSFPILKKDIESFIEEFDNPKQKTSVGMQKQWGSRRAIQRFLSLTIALQSFTTTVITNFFTANMLSAGAIGTAVFSLITGVGLSILLHRGSIWVGWKNQFYNKKKKEIENELSGHDNIQQSMEIFSYNEQLFLKLRMLCTELLKDNTLNTETKMLLHNNLNLLKQYSQEYDLQAINIIYNNCKQIEIYINDETIKSELNKFIEYLGKMTIDDPKEYKGIGHGFVPAAEIIQEETQRCLANWLTILETNVINKNTIDAIISNALQIMKLTSFSSETLKGTNKDNLISELQDFISFYDKTIQSFKKLPKAEQEQLQPEIEILEKIGQYALMYYKALNYLVSTEILYGYRISKGNKMYFLEVIGIMNIVRKIYGIQTGIYISKKNFKKEIIKVKNLGNELISGLYDSKLEQSIDEFFKEKEKPKYFYLGINESWKVRKMLARFLPLIFFTRSVVSGILTNSFSLNSVTVSFFTGVGLSIILHWLPILSGFFKTKTIKQVKFPFREKQNINNDIAINKQLLLQKQVNKLINVPYGDIPDLVIIAGNNIDYTTDILNSSMEKIKTYGNFKNLNIETLLLNNDGGSGNSLIDIFSFLQSDDLKIKYPNLIDKDLSEMKIVVINIDGAPSSSVTQPLDVEVITQKTTPIELALLNGIGLIQKNKKENGNIVIVDPSYMYLGNLAQTDNITLLSANITYDQMETQKLPLFISNPLESSAGSSSNRLKKIYNKFNNNKIVNIVVKYMLYKIYDIDNLSIQQMPTFAGIIAMNFTDKKKFQAIIRFMNIAKQYEQNYKGEKFQIDMMAHLLVPLTRLLNDEDIFVYLENLKYSVDDIDKENYDKFFWGLFNELNNNFQRITAADSYINVITSQDSLMTKIQPDNKFYKKFITIFSLLKQFNIKQQITSVKRDITNFILPQKKTALFIVPQMTDLVKQHIVAFDNDSSNNFTITSLNQLSDNKKDSGIIINVPIENTIIPAKVMYDMFIDDKGKNHIIIAFMPILFDDIDMYCSVQETEILNSILSDDKTDINQIRQKMFIGRATLSLIKELQLNNGKSLIMEDSSFIMQKIEPSVIISFDDFGIFATPQLVSDSFVKDENLQSIQHLNMNISDNTSTDIPIELIKQLHLSNMVNEYNVTEDNKVHLSILSSLISNYNFSFKELDIASLLNKPKQYAENMMNMVFNSSSPNDVSNSINNIGILPTISLKKFSDIKKYCELFSGTMLDKIIIQNILFYDNSINIYNLLNFTLIDIASEINRLNNPQFNKLKELLDVKESINKEMSTNEIFVLNNLLNYLKSNEKEKIKFQQFINNQSTAFSQELEYLTAIQINKNLQNVSNQDIEILKKQNADKWNFYYSLNEYMQYIAYIQYNNMQQYLASHQIRMIVAYDLLKHKDNMELILQELTVLKNKYNVNGFYINNLFVHKYQEQVMKFLRVNIPNDTTLIFDNANYGLINQYTNTYIVSDNTASNSITNDIKEELIQLDLYNIKNTDIVNTIQDLSKRYKLVSMIINITDVFDNTDLMNDIFSINKLLKENNKNIEYYSDQAAGTVDKYQKQLSQDTTNGIISRIDISNINDINEEQMFEYVYKVLQEANINMENYKYIWEYIDKLKVNYEYAKQYRQQIALMQLKGYLAGIYNCQNIVDLGMQNYKINLISMNSILRSA